MKITVTCQPGEIEAARRRLHDVRGAVMRFGTMISALQSGYVFDKERDAELLTLLSEALAVIDREVEELTGACP